MEAVRVVRVMQAGGRRAGGAWQVMQRQPGWVSRLAIGLFVLIIALPILLLFLLAIAAATLVFIALAAVNTVMRAITGLFSGTAGSGGSPAAPRRPSGVDASGRSNNVRVVRRPAEP